MAVTRFSVDVIVRACDDRIAKVYESALDLLQVLATNYVEQMSKLPNFDQPGLVKVFTPAVVGILPKLNHRNDRLRAKSAQMLMHLCRIRFLGPQCVSSLVSDVEAFKGASVARCHVACSRARERRLAGMGSIGWEGRRCARTDDFVCSNPSALLAFFFCPNDRRPHAPPRPAPPLGVLVRVRCASRLRRRRRSQLHWPDAGGCVQSGTNGDRGVWCGREVRLRPGQPHGGLGAGPREQAPRRAQSRHRPVRCAGSARGRRLLGGWCPRVAVLWRPLGVRAPSAAHCSASAAARCCRLAHVATLSSSSSSSSLLLLLLLLLYPACWLALCLVGALPPSRRGPGTLCCT
jgi:hypothetical protein